MPGPVWIQFCSDAFWEPAFQHFGTAYYVVLLTEVDENLVERKPWSSKSASHRLMSWNRFFSCNSCQWFQLLAQKFCCAVATGHWKMGNGGQPGPFMLVLHFTPDHVTAGYFFIETTELWWCQPARDKTRSNHYGCNAFETWQIIITRASHQNFFSMVFRWMTETSYI